MIYSGRATERIKRMAAELNMFWQLSADVSTMKQRLPAEICHDEVADLRDELDVLSDMSDWTGLKNAIRSLISELDGMSEALGAVA